jgi:hypothetical protein
VLAIIAGLDFGALSARTGFDWFSPLFDWDSWRHKDLWLSANPTVVVLHIAVNAAY